MYYVWEQMVQYDKGELTVHLMLNHASRWADIHSHRPHSGKLEVMLKKDLQRLRVRAPEWIGSGASQVTVSKNETPISIDWDGRYLVVQQLQASDRITIIFPLQHKTMERTIGRQDFTLTFRGNTVIDLQPAGSRIPLYQRKSMNTDAVPMRSVIRYVAESNVSCRFSVMCRKTPVAQPSLAAGERTLPLP